MCFGFLVGEGSCVSFVHFVYLGVGQGRQSLACFVLCVAWTSLLWLVSGKEPRGFQQKVAALQPTGQ